MTASHIASASPCVRICLLDATGSLCTGCGRTIDEIAAWSGLSEGARLAIMGELGEWLRLRSSGAA